MAINSINTSQRYLLNGQEVNASNEWEDVTIRADYSGDSIQPQLTIEDFRFSLEAREAILKWIREGNIFEGMPISITLFNNQPQEATFESLLDFRENNQNFLDDGVIEAGLIKLDGLDWFFNQIETVSYGYLEEIGVFTQADYKEIDYIVQPPFQPIEIILCSISIYILQKELAKAVEELQKALLQETTALAQATFGSAVAAALGKIGNIIIRAAYIGVIIIAITSLMNQLFDLLINPKRQHKVIYFRTLLEKVCNYYGFAFDTNVDLFDKLYYLPSNIQTDVIGRFGSIDLPRGTRSGISIGWS